MKRARGDFWATEFGAAMTFHFPVPIRAHSDYFSFADNALRIRQAVGPRISDVYSSKFPTTDCGRAQRTLMVR